MKNKKIKKHKGLWEYSNVITGEIAGTVEASTYQMAVDAVREHHMNDIDSWNQLGLEANYVITKVTNIH